MQIMFKPVIYVIYDKSKCLSSLILICYLIPQLNCKFQSLAVSFQCMILLVNFAQKIAEKNLSHQ